MDKKKLIDEIMNECLSVIDSKRKEYGSIKLAPNSP